MLKSCCSSVLSNKRAGERVPSIGRKIGCVQRIGHVKNYRFASKKPSARAVFGCARPRHVVSSAQPRSRTSVLALHQPSLGRRNGLVRRIGHIKISQIWLRNCRARPDSGRTRTSTAAVEKHVQGTLSRLRRILSAALAACPPANPPGARPPPCLPARGEGEVCGSYGAGGGRSQPAPPGPVPGRFDGPTGIVWITSNGWARLGGQASRREGWRVYI